MYLVIFTALNDHNIIWHCQYVGSHGRNTCVLLKPAVVTSNLWNAGITDMWHKSGQCYTLGVRS